MTALPRPLHALTVDVEEYFQVSGFADVIERGAWERLESRVGLGLSRLLDLFDAHAVKATFFVLGWVADHAGSQVARIAEHGHEIASHGYEHRLVTDLDPASFRADLDRAAEAIRRAAGVEVRGFRAPSFSFSKATPWAWEVLAEAGCRYSSSVFPIRHDRYGIPDFPRHPVRIRTRGDRGLWEFPMTTWRLLGRNVPAAGGGWLRALPLVVAQRALGAAERAGWPGVVYVHPWEFDPAQPRIDAASRASRLRHYVNLERTEERLDRLLARFAFAPMTTVLDGLDEAPVRARLHGLGIRGRETEATGAARPAGG
ncbi:MAG: XrtA system polysaccharide deacetylase [Planctomycetota bacterium]